MDKGGLHMTELTNRQIRELANFMGVSESYVEQTDSQTLSEKFFMKLIREGYKFESAEGGGFTLSKYD